MGGGKMRFDLNGFKIAHRAGFLLPETLSYGYVDAAKYDSLWKKRIEEGKEDLTPDETFKELQQRMSGRYFSKVSMAQMAALDYSSLMFPPYSILSSEDLSDDWLAIVDFHKKHSRDHSLHQPLTAYVAAKLLGFGKSKDSLQIPQQPNNLLDYCVESLFSPNSGSYILEEAKKFGIGETMLKKSEAAKEFWKDLFYHTVLLSAVFHDIGYPWQYVSRVGKSLNNSVSYLHPSDSVAIPIVERFKDRMVYLPLRKYQASHHNEPAMEIEKLVDYTTLALETHGFPGAIAFLSLNDAIRKHPTEAPLARLQEFSIEWAAIGIFMHDMEGKHRKFMPEIRLKISQDPLSVIISLADYLEEFDRPKVSFYSRSRQSRMKYYSDCSGVEVNVDASGVMDVCMEYRKESGKVIAAEFKTKETDNYFNPSNGYVDLSGIGIKRVVYKQK
jgi:hypothetical protein